MGDFPREADGRRFFSTEFKRGVVRQLSKGEKTLAEVSRELDIQPSVIREWTRRVEAGAKTAVSAYEDVVPASALRGGRTSGFGSSSASWARSRWRSRSSRRPRRS